METSKNSFWNRFDIHKLRFGTKINILVFSVMMVSITLITIIGARQFKKILFARDLKNLEHIAVIKKDMLESNFAEFLTEIPYAFSDDINYTIDELLEAYNNYRNERYMAFEPDSLEYFSDILDTFYINNQIKNTLWSPPALEYIKATGEQQIVMQATCVIRSHAEETEIGRLTGLSDNTTYNYTLQNIQKKLKILAGQNSFNNIYLIDKKSGNVFYVYNKNIVLGNNIFDSYLKNTNLAVAFQKALALPGYKGAAVTDFENFIAAQNKPVAFCSLPIFVDGQVIAVAVLEIAPAFYEKLLYSSEHDLEENPVSYVIIGPDNLLRTNDIGQVADAENYFRKLLNADKNNKQFIKAAGTGAGALSLSYNHEVKSGKYQLIEARNYSGDNVLLANLPLDMGGLNWSLIVQKTNRHLHGHSRNLAFIMSGVLIVLILFGFLITRYFRESMLQRINSLKFSMQKLAIGENATIDKNEWHDELGLAIDVYNQLNSRIYNAGNFALQLSDGNYNIEFGSQSENDNFAKALNTLKQKLQQNKLEAEQREREDKIRNWTNEGIARFNDLLRQSNNNIQNLSYIIIENLIEYLGANLGGVYMVEGETDSLKSIQLVASYAFDRRKYQAKTIEIGEGLIGNCYLERKPVYLKKLPEDYIEIVSGLGRSIPKALYITPLVMDVEILGFIEIASLEEFEDYKIEFINKLADNIAATFASVKLNSKTAELLEESKRRSHEIAQQEEEMRQNLEEMQATQEELARLRDEDEQRTQALKDKIDNLHDLVSQLANNIPGEVYIKDTNGVIILANERAAHRFDMSPDKLLGKTENDLFAPERAEIEQQLDFQAHNDGVYTTELAEMVGNKEIQYKIEKKQIFLHAQKEMGILTRMEVVKH
ncbi:MAG: GAF domain-containing protein [Bacteroidales bacterium]|nr:GAF domain-containing protein [Bacteroidales bacterium]